MRPLPRDIFRGVVGVLFVLLLSAPLPATPPLADTTVASGVPQFEAWRWASFTVEAGLPSNEITALAETDSHTVWVGTSAGLAWYDEFQWNAVDSTHGLPRRWVTGIHALRGDSVAVLMGGPIYVGTRAGFRKLPLPPVSVAAALPNGELLLYADRTIARFYDGQVKPVEGTPELTDGEFLPLRRTPKGGVYLVARSGVYAREEGGWRMLIPSSPSSRTMVTGTVDGGAGTFGAVSVDLPIELRGLWRWNGRSPATLTDAYRGFTFRVMASRPAGGVLGITANGEAFWAGPDGPHRVVLNRSEIEDVRLLQYRANGSLWVGTASGLYYHNAAVQRWRFWRHAVGDPRNDVNEVMRAADGSIWLATVGGVEVHTPDGRARTMDRAGDVRLQILTGLAQDDEGNVWVSSGSALFGAYRWNGSRWDHVPIGDDPDDTRIHRIRRDRRGRLWFLGLSADFSRGIQADRPGAFVLEHGKFTRWGRPEGLLRGRVYAFTEGRDSSLWFGSLGGISRWKDGRWTYWTSQNGLLFPTVFALATDSVGRVWFGGQTNRLGYIERDSIHYLSPSDYPIRGTVWDLRVDAEGTLWVSGRDEVMSYSDGEWLVFDAASGLGKFDVWPVEPIGDEVYVGTRGNGTAILNVQDGRAHVPRIRIDPPYVNTSVLLRWRAFAFWGEVTPSGILSRFRIDDGPWSDWEARTEVTLESLPPGPHRLMVQARGLLGNYGPGASREFVIEAPYYRRAVFIIPAILTALAIGALGSLLILRKRRHDAELRESEMKFRRLTEAAFEGIVLHDNGVVVDANESVLATFGYAHDELVGKHLVLLAAPSSRSLVRELLQSESERPAEAIGRRKDGAPIFLEMIAKSIPAGRGDIGVVAIRDITQRKRTEDQLLMYQRQLRSLAQELSTTEAHERRRMAAYLHDTINQALAFCKIKLSQVDASEPAPELREVRRMIEETLQNAQSLTFELSPPVLYELSFQEALRWLCEQHEEQHGVPVAFRANDAADDVPEDIRVVLFNAARELLVNVAKHAGARTASVELRRQAREVAIAVADDGRGFTPSSSATAAGAARGGFGLFNIRERLAHLGGKLDIDSMPGRGTVMTIAVPLEEGGKEGESR